MLRYLNLLLVVLVCSSLFSCVANRKYQEEIDAKNTARQNEQAALVKAQEAEEQLALAQQEIEKVQTELRTIEKDYNLVKTRYEQQQRLNKDLQDSYDKLLELNEKLTAEAAGKRRELSEEVARKEAELRRKEEELQRREREMKELQAKMDAERAEINRLQADLEAQTASVNNLQGDKSALQADKSALMKDLEAREARVKELEAAIAARDEKANALRDRLKEALLGFEDSDLSVEMRNGKVYVSLSQNLLFATGSSKLDSKGADALTKLASVLKKNKGINVLVEGHTDSDGDAKMNWELSTKRSLSIVDLLTKNDVAPSRITAAGRGEFAPIASNDTAAGKARNRRTDIILSPQLDEIMNILKK